MTPDEPGAEVTGMMVLMRVWKPGRSTVDAAVSVFAALVTAAGTWDRVASWLPHAVTVPLALAQGLLLLARRRSPLTVLAATTVIGAFMIAVGYPVGDASFATWCAAYAVAVYTPRGGPAEPAGMLRGAAAAVAAAVVLAAAAAAPGARDRQSPWGLFLFAALIAASWVLGYAVRTRRDLMAELRERAARLEAEEGERAARAVLDERLRIARELHDVIGHSISVITVQAEAAARAARTDPDAVPDFLTRIAGAGRQALGEMRGVLAVLRPDAGAEMGPQPGLEQLGELVAMLNAGGVRTRLDLQPMDLPPGIALTVYRIVQESLTNVIKHAGAGAKAAVTVSRSGGSVRVCVRDDGAGPRGHAVSTAHGIVGMRERAAAYGGSLAVGARPEGGFEVEALIPLPKEAA